MWSNYAVIFEESQGLLSFATGAGWSWASTQRFKIKGCEKCTTSCMPSANYPP
jgi:hypothetical protein